MPASIFKKKLVALIATVKFLTLGIGRYLFNLLLKNDMDKKRLNVTLFFFRNIM